MPKPVPIDPAKLLEAAQQFASHHSAQGRPRPIWLRRAVSTAYYALYHALCRQAADHLVGSSPQPDRLRLARAFSHQAVKEVCEWIAGRRGKPPQRARHLIDALQTSPLAQFAGVFCDLQEARHAADYDHLEAFPKQTVLQHIDDAERAIAILSGASAWEREMLFALIALKTQLR